MRWATLGVTLAWLINSGCTGSDGEGLELVPSPAGTADALVELPAAPLPKANYNIICVPPGENVMYVSGHLPLKVSWR